MCDQFFQSKIINVRFRISVPKDVKIGDVAMALPKKMVITTWPNMHVITYSHTANIQRAHGRSIFIVNSGKT